MEKDYVKDTYKGLALFVSVSVVYLAAWIYSLLNEYEYGPFMVNWGYGLAGATVGMLLGCLYGWLYLKEKTMVILAVTSFLAIGAYFGVGLFFIQSLLVGAYWVGSFFLIILFFAFSYGFRSSIKQERDNEQRWAELEKKFEQEREERIRKAVEDALVKHITKKVVDSLKQSR